MSTEVLICAVCASSDFLVDNVSIFHLGMGLLLGSTLSLRFFEKWDLGRIVGAAMFKSSRCTAQGGLDLH